MLSVILVGFPTSFNSRTREGCDRLDEVSKETGEFQFTHPRGVRCVSPFTLLICAVSIHAPARGAILQSQALQRGLGFNSRTREGCDGALRHALDLNKFQFTHPRGVRCVPKLTSSNIGSFNSRTREGCDINITKKINNFQVSIHAPARGAIPLVSMVLLSF